MGALGFPPLHGALGEAGGNGAAALDGGGTDFYSLRIVEGSLPGHCQLPGVAFGSGGLRPAVPLVSEHIPDRLRCQRVGLVGAAQRQDSAGVCFLKQRVSAVPALGGRDLPAQRGAVPDHGGNAQLGELPGVDGGRMDKEDAARILVNDISQHIVDDLCLAYLGRGHENDVADLRVAEGVHDGPEIGRPAGAPQPRLSAGLRGEVPLALRPLGHRQVLRRFHPGQDFGSDTVQLPDIPATRRHPHHLPNPSAPGHAPHTWRGHTGTGPNPSSPRRPPV